MFPSLDDLDCVLPGEAFFPTWGWSSFLTSHKVQWVHCHPINGGQFLCKIYLQLTAAFLYVCISRQGENRKPCICELLHMIPCFYKQLNSLFLCWVFIPYFPLPYRENRRSLCIHLCKWKSWDHIITGLQSALWLHSPGKKGFKINTSESHI